MAKRIEGIPPANTVHVTNGVRGRRVQGREDVLTALSIVPLSLK